jgi:hypothetical protein
MKKRFSKFKPDLTQKYPGIEIGKISSTVKFKPILDTSGIRAWIRLKRALLREKKDHEEEKERPRDEEKDADYFPKVHLDDGPDAWYTQWDVTKNGGLQKFYITNNGLRTSSLTVVETYEAPMNLYGIPLGNPYVVVLNNRGFIKNLHPGQTKTITLQWNPDTTKPATHLMVAAYDPVLDPKMPLNYHPGFFPDYHIKHNGHAVTRLIGSPI